MNVNECKALERAVGFVVAGAICVTALIMDGTTAAVMAISVAGGCAGVGAFLGARKDG